MPAADLETDVLIIGGGVAGLWTLRRLLSRGLSAILIEREALGAGQTIASQGIIHGGLKYTLGPGAGGAAAGAIAGMPARWRAALQGTASVDPDLREATVLSPTQYLFTAPGFAARLVGAAASRVIRTEVARLKPFERPASLAGAAASTDVYRVEEPVLDPRSVLACLASHATRHIFSAVCIGVEPASAGLLVHVQNPSLQKRAILAPAVVLAAGEGNAGLLVQFAAARQALPPPVKEDAEEPGAMQRRPLHMVMVRSPSLPPLYAHCVGHSSRPLLTITSQRDAARGDTVWYIGGELAERGVERDERAQIRAAREDLARLLPWIDLAGARFATLPINRAEGASRAGARPDVPTLQPVRADGRVLVAWPTKLAFAPLLADMIESRLRESGISFNAGAAHADPAARLALPSPAVARLPWEREDIQWS